MPGTITFFADKGRQTPVNRARLAAISQGRERLMFTCFMPDEIFFAAAWDGEDPGVPTLTLAFFKAVGDDAHLCFSEQDPAQVDHPTAGTSVWNGSFRLLDVPWGEGTYQVRIYHDRALLAEGAITLAGESAR